MGRCLMLLLLTMAAVAGSAQEAYSVLTEADSTLAFFYDDQRSSRPGTSYSLDIIDSISSPEWYKDRLDISKVVFDTTFVAARPTSTQGWFRGMDKLYSITGITYLNTDSVTNMEGMFAGNSLASLDVSGFNTSNVTNMQFMFAG